jgi:hypothetical protein
MVKGTKRSIRDKISAWSRLSRFCQNSPRGPRTLSQISGREAVCAASDRSILFLPATVAHTLPSCAGLRPVEKRDLLAKPHYASRKSVSRPEHGSSFSGLYPSLFSLLALLLCILPTPIPLLVQNLISRRATRISGLGCALRFASIPITKP